MLEFLMMGRVAPVFSGGSYALFVGGVISVSLAQKYHYVSAIVTPATNLLRQKSYFAAAGNSVLGIMRGTSVANEVTEKRTFASDIASNGIALTQARWSLTAASTPTFGLYIGGLTTGSTHVTSSDKLNFGSNTRAGGGWLTTGRELPAAVGNATHAIISGGYNSGYLNTTEKHNHADNTVVVGTNMSAGRSGPAATGTTEFGIIAAGYVTGTTDKYVYATDARTLGTALGQARGFLAGAGNSTVGIFGGGRYPTQSAHVDAYVYTSAAVTTGTSLSQANSAGAALTSSPGGF